MSRMPAATVLVCAHGLACSARDWDGFAASVGDWGEMVALSLPGHDGTASEGVATIAKMADWFSEQRDAFGDRRQILVGHSMGARVVLEAAARRSNRIAGIVLIDSSLQAAGSVDEVIRARRSLSPAELEVRKEALFGGMLCGRPMGAFQSIVMARLAAMEPATIHALSESIAIWDADSASDRLAEVDLPLLVLQSTTAEGSLARRSIAAGEDTRWTSLARDRAGCRASIVNLFGLGHFPHVEAPDVVSSAITRSFAPDLAIHDLMRN